MCFHKNKKSFFIIMYIWFFALFLSHIVITEQRFTGVPDGFGKTHFIQGLVEYPEKYITRQKKDNDFQNFSCSVLFSPAQTVCDRLCELINQEQSKIYIAVYTLTDSHIAKALIAAKKRGVHIEIITDRGSPLDRNTKIGALHMVNIPIFLYQPPLLKNIQKGLMHNKFALFFNNYEHRQFIWHGSFNFSYAGYKHNCESILIMQNTELFKQFLEEFERIKQKSIRYCPL